MILLFNFNPNKHTPYLQRCYPGCTNPHRIILNKIPGYENVRSKY